MSVAVSWMLKLITRTEFEMVLVIILSVLAASAAILAWLPIPFLWIALLWAAVLSVLAVRHKQTSLRMLCQDIALYTAGEDL